MKILAINGSPRGMGGMTGRLLEEVLAGVEESGAEVEVVCLSETPIKPCVACDACHRVGLCPVRDEFEPLKEKLLAADAFVLASPNYFFSVSGQLKCLLDRCNGLAHRTELEGKYAAAVLTSGSGQDEDVLKYLVRFVNSLGAQSVGGISSAGAGPRVFPDQEALFQGARALGRELCACVREKRAFPEQDEWRQTFRGRMQYLVSLMGEIWPFEREYWSKR